MDIYDYKKNGKGRTKDQKFKYCGRNKKIIFDYEKQLFISKGKKF